MKKKKKKTLLGGSPLDERLIVIGCRHITWWVASLLPSRKVAIAFHSRLTRYDLALGEEGYLLCERDENGGGCGVCAVQER